MFTIQDLKKTFKIYDSTCRSLKPKNKMKYVGIELECILPLPDYGDESDDTARKLLLAAFISNGLEKKVRIGYDLSIKYKKNKESNAEIRILDTERKIFSTIEKVCKILSEFNVRVNNSCGLHVHLDMRYKSQEELRKIFNNLIKSQDFLITLVEKRRRNGQYSQKLNKTFTSKPKFKRDNFGFLIKDNFGRYIIEESPQKIQLNWDNVVEHDFKNHRHGLNMLDAYRSYKTFEIRFHEATLNSNKINQWIAILLKITKSKFIENDLTKDNYKKILKLGETNVTFREN